MFDSSGHIVKWDYTVEDFATLEWESRARWVEAIAARYELGRWLDDITGAIRFLGSDPRFSQLNGWASNVDAAILQAINDGIRLAFRSEAPIGYLAPAGSLASFAGKVHIHGGELWAQFFRAINPHLAGPRPQLASDDELIDLRLRAEQHGVDYALAHHETRRRYASADPWQRSRIDIFLAGADGYRWLAPKYRYLVGGRCTASTHFLCEATDPRTASPYLAFLGNLLLELGAVVLYTPRAVGELVGLALN
ncbi:MAG: hypothetical protein L0332_09500 [Chloroflexi bacterium]|nr:hypothetical protein [Chloroflexota bacterium]MCI0647295.1 hypothetical protein [Chloroflexota bacterium]MCI0726941.1 hypothetical protein [Chloroflexota bacterium]